MGRALAGFGIAGVALASMLVTLAPGGGGATLWILGSGAALALFVLPAGLATVQGPPRLDPLPAGAVCLAFLLVPPWVAVAGSEEAGLVQGLGFTLLSMSWGLSLTGLQLFLVGARVPVLGAQVAVTLGGALVLLGPYLADPLLLALSDGPRTRLIQALLTVHPLGACSEGLGVDWLRGAESYRLSSIGSLHFFRYPAWPWSSSIHALLGVSLGAAGWLLVRRKRKVPSSSRDS